MVIGDVTPTTNGSNTAPESGAGESRSWMLKPNVTVFRRADSTRKQKLKYSVPINKP